jgi:hypothetical protein
MPSLADDRRMSVPSAEATTPAGCTPDGRCGLSQACPPSNEIQSAGLSICAMKPSCLPTIAAIPAASKNAGATKVVKGGIVGAGATLGRAVVEAMGQIVLRAAKAKVRAETPTRAMARTSRGLRRRIRKVRAVGRRRHNPVSMPHLPAAGTRTAVTSPRAGRSSGRWNGRATAPFLLEQRMPRAETRGARRAAIWNHAHPRFQEGEG